ncbi:DUF427 domain-containing protein [Vreelandella sp. H-I2]
MPREDVLMDLLTPSGTATHCPLKIHTVYFLSGLGDIQVIAYSNEQKNKEIKSIAAREAFGGARRTRLEVGPASYVLLFFY